MKVFLPNPVVDKQIETLVKSFKSRMNGETAHQMQERGMVYESNYGISLVHLKEMAKALPRDMALADRLWYRPIRETMILATLIAPHEQFGYEQGLEWAQQISTSELVEQAALNLFSRVNSASRLVEQWLQVDDEFMSGVAFYTLGWMYRFQEVSGELQKLAWSKLSILDGEGQFCRYRGAAHFIRQLLRIHAEEKTACAQLASGFARSKNTSLQWLAKEVEQEIAFLP